MPPGFGVNVTSADEGVAAAAALCMEHPVGFENVSQLVARQTKWQNC